MWPTSVMLQVSRSTANHPHLSPSSPPQAFSVFFVCVAFTSDIICLLFIPVQWLFFAASTYVWVQYVWHTGKSRWPIFDIELFIIIIHSTDVFLQSDVSVVHVGSAAGVCDLCPPGVCRERGVSPHCVSVDTVRLHRSSHPLQRPEELPRGPVSTLRCPLVKQHVAQGCRHSHVEHEHLINKWAIKPLKTIHDIHYSLYLQIILQTTTNVPYAIPYESRYTINKHTQGWIAYCSSWQQEKMEKKMFSLCNGCS